MDTLLSLAKDGLFATLFVLSALVNIYQYKLNQQLQDRRIDDWKTTLGSSNALIQSSQKLQETSNTLIQGVSVAIQRLLDKNNLT